MTLRLNLLDAGQNAPRPWRWQFGIQATPVKPIPRDWRRWRLQPGIRGNVSILWPTPQPDSLLFFGYPQATQPAVFDARIAALHAQGVGAVPYSCLSYLSGASPEFQWYGDAWSQGAGDTASSDVAAYGAVFEMVCPERRDWNDFAVWKNVQLMQQHGVDGFYHDNTHPYPCREAATGCGWVDEAGRRHADYKILAYRALYRRHYATVKDIKPDAFQMAHMSGKVTIPILAYEDAYLDGEHYRGRVKDSYLDLMTLDEFRAEFMGRQWGVMPYFLPEFDQAHRKQVEPTRGLMGLLLLHDVQPWPLWCNADVVNEALDALDRFGWVDSDFMAYFDPVPPATVDAEDVHASAWRRADGRALVLVANLSREDREVAVTLARDRLELPTDRVVSWPDGGAVERQGDQLRLAVPGLGYRLLLIGNAP